MHYSSSGGSDPRIRRAVILGGGQITVGPRVLEILNGADLYIAADGGTVHCLKLGIQPHLVLGDLDSISPETLAEIQTLGWHVRSYPREKDFTDGELALREALSRGAEEIILLGLLLGSDRIDHGLANVFLLSLPETIGHTVRLVDEGTEVLMLRSGESVLLRGVVGDVVTLLPFTEPAGGVTTWGMKYDLSGDSLHMGSTRGVSNQLRWSWGKIELGDGLLCVVHQSLGEPHTHFG